MLVRYLSPMSRVSVSHSRTGGPTGTARARAGDYILDNEKKLMYSAMYVHIESDGDPVEIAKAAPHNHMLNAEPRLFFVHFWANDDAVTLARGLRSALDKMHVKRPGA